MWNMKAFQDFDLCNFIEYKTKSIRVPRTAIVNSTLNPYNAVYYSAKYNGLANVTSVYQAPMFASKPYYFQCNIL